MLDNLKFLKYVRSFTEGRVRLRHPALENARIAAMAQDALSGIPGVLEASVNTQTGSALLLYDPVRVTQDMLVEKGVLWAQWLDNCLQSGTVSAPPAL